MSIIQAIILGLVQGLTEFIPVSSSGHLVLLHNIMGISYNTLAFDVALHAGTLIALLAYFRRDIIALIKSLFDKSHSSKLAYLLMIATLPAAILGYLLEDSASSTFRNVSIVGWTMIGFGLIMLVAEKIYERRKIHTALDNTTLSQAIIMGLAQSLALVPGVSRSGSTITAGLFVGLDRVSATRFSFLLGIPIMFGAIIKVFSDPAVISIVYDDKYLFMVGIVTALLSGLFAIKFMLKYLSNHGLFVFAYYRIALGVIILVILGLD